MITLEEQLKALRERMDRMEDRNQLIESLHRLQRAIDERDWDAIRAIFTTDASGYGIEGCGAILATMKDHLGGVGPTQHLLGNELVEIDGDVAITRAHVRVHHLGDGPMEGSFLECLGQYTDSWVRTGNGWRLARRDLNVHHAIGDWGVLRPA